MPGMGILCNREALRNEIEKTLRLLILQNGLEEIVEEIRIFQDGSFFFQQPDKEPGKALSYFVLSWKDQEQSFHVAESLWQQEPALSIIYVAQTVEDVFAALQMPFFHIVREFYLEQDLRAALKKLERIKRPILERVSFLRNNKQVILKRREILYLESQHHEIFIHLNPHDGAKEKEIVIVTESLISCEEKLKGMGFVRIHKSLLVNMYHIHRLEKESVLLDNKERLYISRYRYAEVKQQLEHYIRKLEFM